MAQPNPAPPNAPQSPKNTGQPVQGRGPQSHPAPQGPQMTIVSYPVHPSKIGQVTLVVGQVMSGLTPTFGPDLQPKLADAEAEVNRLKQEKIQLESQLKASKDAKVAKAAPKMWKTLGKCLLIALVACALVYAGIMIGANGGQATMTVGNTIVSTPTWPNLAADLAAAVNSQTNLQKEIDRLKSANVADINSASREQARLRAELERVMADNSKLTSSGLSGELTATKAKLATMEATLAQVTSKCASDLASQAETYEERLRGAAEACGAQCNHMAAVHTEEIKQLGEENMKVLASKDTTIGNLRFQLATDQILVETYRAIANGDMAHLGERVTVDVVAFAPRNASFQLTLDSGAKTEDGTAIIQTVTGTCSQAFPTPTASFQTNSALYTIGATINGRTFETGKQFLGVAGETVYMQLHGETFFRQLRFDRATIVMWTGSCKLVRSNPKSNRLPLSNGSRVQLPDGTMIEVQNGQPTTAASASK